MIVEYKLDAGPRGMVTPYWVKDGGYFQDPDNHTLVGWTPNKPGREFKIPDSVLTLTQDAFVSRILDIHSRYPMLDEDRNALTQEAVTEIAVSWYTSKEV